MEFGAMVETSSPSKLSRLAEPAELLPPTPFFSALQIFQPDEEDRQRAAVRTTTSSFPQWKREELKSWIWMQQALHPEVDYERGIRQEWKRAILWKPHAIKKWLVERKQNRKEQERLEKAEVHAAVSVASIAAALAAVAAENEASLRSSSSNNGSSKTLRESAVASAAALVAARCAKAAEDVGAKRQQLVAAIKAARAATDTSAILTLTAAAATSLRGAATLRERSGVAREMISGCAPALPTDEPVDFQKAKASLANGAEFIVVMSDGVAKRRTACVLVGRDAQVALRIKKSRVIAPSTRTKECTINEVAGSHDEDAVSQPHGGAEEARRCYTIGLTTSNGKVELKTGSLSCCRVWTTTIAYMLMMSSTFRGHI